MSGAAFTQRQKLFVAGVATFLVPASIYAGAQARQLFSKDTKAVSVDEATQSQIRIERDKEAAALLKEQEDVERKIQEIKARAAR